jgi:hypothetical protein
MLKLMAKVIYLVRRHAKPRTTLIKKCAKASAEGIVPTQPENITRQMDAEAIAQIIEAPNLRRKVLAGWRLQWERNS